MRRFRYERAEHPIYKVGDKWRQDLKFEWCVYDRIAPHGLQIVAWCRDAEQAETIAAAFEDTFGDRR